MARGMSAKDVQSANGPVSWLTTASGAQILVTRSNRIGAGLCQLFWGGGGSSKTVRHTSVEALPFSSVAVAVLGRMITEVKRLHPPKANFSMVATESGMAMLANELHPTK